ncbi:hypothetical protein [Streptomyces virginiae]|uniref:hypothetical protein n=1 Tax=Streptomyces virginiae TaxID=1961 RepID=UPI0036F868B9
MARSDGGALRPSPVRRGAAEVGSQAIAFARFAQAARPVLVNGLPGAVAVAEGRAVSVMAFTVRDGRIIALDILTDPQRLARIDVSAAVALDRHDGQHRTAAPPRRPGSPHRRGGSGPVQPAAPTPASLPSGSARSSTAANLAPGADDDAPYRGTWDGPTGGFWQLAVPVREPTAGRAGSRAPTLTARDGENSAGSN